MLERVINLVKEGVIDTISGVTDIPEDKKAAAVETTTDTLIEELKKYATPANISKLTSMLGIGNAGNGNASTAVRTNESAGVSGNESAGHEEVASDLESGIASALISKVGLNASMAQKITAAVIPAIKSLFKKKLDDDNDPDFNIGSLIGSFTGKSDSDGKGGVMDMLGSLLGK